MTLLIALGVLFFLAGGFRLLKPGPGPRPMIPALPRLLTGAVGTAGPLSGIAPTPFMDSRIPSARQGAFKAPGAPGPGPGVGGSEREPPARWRQSMIEARVPALVPLQEMTAASDGAGSLDTPGQRMAKTDAAIVALLLQQKQVYRSPDDDSLPPGFNLQHPRHPELGYRCFSFADWAKYGTLEAAYNQAAQEDLEERLKRINR